MTRRKKAAPPEPPEHLDAGAVAKWQELARGLDPSRPGVGDALACYCAAYSRWTAAEAQVAALGLIVKSASGLPTENPYLTIVKKAMVEMHRWGRVLGLQNAKAPRGARAPDPVDEEIARLTLLDLARRLPSP
jgi:P27 family predicted phage terminase small subunit